MGVLRRKYASESNKIRTAFLGAAAEIVAQPFHSPLLPLFGRS